MDNLVEDVDQLFKPVITSLSEIEADVSLPTIFFTVDERYAPYAAVTLISVLEKCDKPRFNILVASLGLCDPSTQLFTTILNRYRVSGQHVQISESVVSEFNSDQRISKVAYLSVFLPRIIKSKIALFLDADLIVLSDISELLALGNKLKLVAGCEENQDKSHMIRLGLNTDFSYLNSGVVLFNTDEWRHQQMSQKARIGYRQLKFVRWHDQDLLNLVSAGNAQVLERQWNMRKVGADIPFTKDELIGDSGILHFNGPVKPWMPQAPELERNVYEKYASISLNIGSDS